MSCATDLIMGEDVGFRSNRSVWVIEVRKNGKWAPATAGLVSYDEASLMVRQLHIQDNIAWEDLRAQVYEPTYTEGVKVEEMEGGYSPPPQSSKAAQSAQSSPTEGGDTKQTLKPCPISGTFISPLPCDECRKCPPEPLRRCIDCVFTHIDDACVTCEDRDHWTPIKPGPSPSGGQSDPSDDDIPF